MKGKLKNEEKHNRILLPNQHHLNEENREGHPQKISTADFENEAFVFLVLLWIFAPHDHSESASCQEEEEVKRKQSKEWAARKKLRILIDRKDERKKKQLEELNWKQWRFQGKEE